MDLSTTIPISISIPSPYMSGLVGPEALDALGDSRDVAFEGGGVIAEFDKHIAIELNIF